MRAAFLVFAAVVAGCGESQRASEATGEPGGSGTQAGAGQAGASGGGGLSAGSGGRSGGGGEAGARSYRGTRYPPNPPVCTQSDADATYPEQVLGTTTGLTVTKTDHCDADGNLIQHQCEILPSTDCAPVPIPGEHPPCSEHTGRVIEASPFDCGGACSDGVCESWCPKPEDILNFEVGADSTLVVENETADSRYSCVPHPDSESGCFDLTRYVSGHAFGANVTCYGDVLGIFPVAWSPEGPWNGVTKCYVDCTLAPP